MNTQPITLVGTAPTFAAAATPATVEIGSVLIVKNDSAAPITVTFVTPGTLPTGDAFPDKVYTIAAAAEAWIPVIPSYRSPTNSRFADATFSAVTDVTAAAVRL